MLEKKKAEDKKMVTSSMKVATRGGGKKGATKMQLQYSL